MPCVYILQSEVSSKFYVGSSREDVSFSRLKSHNAGKTRSTKYGRPWILLYEEKFSSYQEARLRENFFKMGQGRKWIREKFGRDGRVDECGGLENRYLRKEIEGSNPSPSGE